MILLQPPTLLTNLQRGNTRTKIPQLYGRTDITFHTLAGQGELTPESIQPGSFSFFCDETIRILNNYLCFILYRFISQDP